MCAMKYSSGFGTVENAFSKVIITVIPKDQQWDKLYSSYAGMG